MIESNYRTNLQSIFHELNETVATIEEERFFQNKEAQKWSIAEEIHHLTLTFIPIINLLNKPAFLESTWGKSNRASRRIVDFNSAYEKSVGNSNWKAFPPFVPKTEFENSTYQRIHSADDEAKVKNFYQLSGTQIQLLREQFQINSNTTKKEILDLFNDASIQIDAAFKKVDEAHLDSLQLPVPYIGLVTLRELEYFTHSHTAHHLKSIKIKIDNQ